METPKRIVIVIVLAVCLSLMFAGCSTRELLKKEYDSLSDRLAEAESMGAKICAPKEYAAAEASLDFAMEEWTERDYMMAKDHLTVASENTDQSILLSANCIELVPPDTDGDGITDDKDKCPQVAEDADGWQDTDGCPDPDNDADGIPDVSDKCPNKPETKNNFQDEDGCPDEAFKKIELTNEQIVLKEKIHFATGKSTIMVDSYGILDEVVLALTNNPKISIRIEGHTDSQGAHDYNQKLSEARAKAVLDYLGGKGISTNRMSAIGFGPDRPMATNNTDKGRAQNRRVEIHITEQ